MTKTVKALADRTKMVKAMEFICRQINNENIFDSWLMCGVADGDIVYGDLDVQVETMIEDEAFWYAKEDEDFAELMACFLRCMKRAEKSGGLYCGDVVSK